MKKTTKIIALLLAISTVISIFTIGGFAVATELDAGGSMGMATNVPQFGVNYVSSLSSPEEEDWFKFTTKSQDAYYKVEMINYSLPEGLHYFQNAYLFLCDKNGKEIGAFHGSYGDGSLSLKLENNTTYYIRVTHEQVSEKGNYEITVSVDYDVVPNEMENAAITQLDKLVASEMDGTSDIDWFKFVAPVSGSYTLTLDNCDIVTNSNSDSRCMNVYLYDKWSQILSSDYTNYDSKAVVTALLEKDETYYVKIYMGGSAAATIGKYTFVIDSPLETSINLEKIIIQSLPTKTIYYVGESFEKNGLVVKAEYSDGTSATVTNYTLSGFDSSVAGTKTVTVSYTENGITKSASFTVNVMSSSEDPEPAPGHQEENDKSDEDTADNSGILSMLTNAFNSVLDFFIWLINLLTNMLS